VGLRQRRATVLGAACLLTLAGCGARTDLDLDLDLAGASVAASSGATSSGGGGSAGGGAGGAGGGAGGGSACGPHGKPIRLATGPSGPFDVTADADYAYWANDGEGTVSRVPLCGGSATVLVSGLNYAIAVAVDDVSVFVGMGVGLRRVPLAGGSSTDLWNGGQFEGVALDSGRVYFVVVSAADPGDVGVWSITKDGSSGASQLYQGPVTRPIAVDAEDVFFSTAQVNGILVKVPKTGGAPVTLANLVVLGDLALDDANVYAATWGAGANVVQIPKGGGGSTLLVGGDNGPITGVAIGHGRVAWTSEDANSAFSVPIGGGPISTLAAHVQTPERIATTPQGFVWVDYNDGAVWASPPY
jgi:hypothetical protein